MAFFSFDANTVAPSSSRECIPAGTYTARVIESSYEPLKSGNGNAVKLTFEIIEGQNANRRVWAQLNVKHSSEMAQKIGQEQLSAICHAVGVMNMQDTSQLHNRPLKIRVKIRKDDQYGDKNEISGYEAVSGGGGIPTIATTNAAAPVVMTPTAASPMPWAKRV